MASDPLDWPGGNGSCKYDVEWNGNGPKPKPFRKRFWEKVRFAGPDECWEWTASRGGKTGYGQIKISTRHESCRMQNSHRVAYELAYGAIPNGSVVRHTCDNRGCVNPSHLVIGTHRDNMNDMLVRGRGVTPHGKLTAFGVWDIRRRLAAGESCRGIAKSIGVVKVAITHIRDRRSWKFLDNPRGFDDWP